MRRYELLIAALGLMMTLGAAGCGSTAEGAPSTGGAGSGGAGGSGGGAPPSSGTSGIGDGTSGNGGSGGSGGDSDNGGGNGIGGSSAAGGIGGSAAGGIGGSDVCQPVACATQGKDCGVVTDGCGGTLDCGSCAADGICGLSAANVCTSPAELCLPISITEACSGKQCGLEGDGCGGTHPCGVCPAGEACGVAAPFQCGVVPVSSETDCPALIESCAETGAECGLIGNGCGGTIDCGGCGPGELCGIVTPQLCDPAPACEPLDAATACADKCGLTSNGCDTGTAGGVIDCTLDFPCPDGESCGGGGVPNQCGSGVACEPLSLGAACGTRECGAASDGCGAAYSCGDCLDGEVCRQGVCETPSCVPTSALVACDGTECGRVGDGCGGIIDCGGCAQGEECGVRSAFQCDPVGCVAATATAACAGKECGLVYDGCGTGPENTFDCAAVNGGGTCPSGELCGVLSPFQCDELVPGPCVPDATTCAGLGWACGKAVDSCGGVHDCATEGRACSSLETCVGGVTGPTQCVLFDSGGACGLCDSVPSCAGQPQLTRLTGRVITPGRDDANVENQVGVPNAFVYILRNDVVGDLPSIATGIPSGGTSCDRCTDPDLGPVLVSAVTDANGEYVLEGNVPVGAEFLLVVKAGKFRRAVAHTLPPSAACQTTALPSAMPDNPTRLPRTMSDGVAVNIPRVAVSTGAVDAMECVLEKMGIAATEFSRPGLGGRIQLYRANGAWPDQQSFDCNACPSGGSPAANSCRLANCGGSAYAAQVSFLDGVKDSALFGSVTSMSAHDLVVFDCEGLGWDETFTQRDAAGANVREYVNRGGRMFASHFGFTWLHGNGSQPFDALDPISTGLAAAATWDTNTYADLTGTGVVSLVGDRPRVSPRIDRFADWLVHHGVTTAPSYSFPMTEPRSQASALGPSSEEFVYRSPDVPAQANPPGYDRRVQQFSFNTPYAAPSDASCGRVSYSGFHVASTAGIASPFETKIFPAHCQDALANDGKLTNQEKALLFMFFDLGTCVGSEPLPPACTPRSCPDDGSCGTLPDGCGEVINCGCSDGGACLERECSAAPCVPTTCEAEGALCASISDGCGSTLECECPFCTPLSEEAACATVSCGYASDGCSDVHFCSSCPADCSPLVQCPAGPSCGTISDGCDGTLECGQCAPGEVCGGVAPNVCASPQCQPLACDDVGAACGTIGDGCGGVVECGQCPSEQVCTNVGGVPNQCQGCEPLRCEDIGADCGLIGDGCGGVVACGACADGQVCGAEAAHRCGSGQCSPSTSCDASAECGVVGDGCGGVIDCGACPLGEVCGIAQPFECGLPVPCTPDTCTTLGAQCGVVSDGCSGVINCGPCQ